MSSDTTKWIVGAVITVVLTVVGTGVALGSLMVSLIGNVQTAVNGRIDDLQDLVNDRVGDLQDVVDSRIGDVQTAIGELRTDVRAYDNRLRNVEIGFAQVDQRLSSLSPAASGAVLNPVVRFDSAGNIFVSDHQQMLEELQTAMGNADPGARSEELGRIPMAVFGGRGGQHGN